MVKIGWVLVLLGWGMSLWGQTEISGGLRGKLVFDDERDGAFRTLILDRNTDATAMDPIAETQADENGRFSFSDISVGRYRLLLEVGEEQLYYIRYEKPVLIESGKRLEVEFRVTAETRLPDVQISEQVLAIAKPGVHLITNEELQRYASVIWDPARGITAFPGIVQTNDQANHFSVRGNSPEYNQWRIEGAEVLSPNHLGNAGTASDRISSNGGGTSMLNTQMLKIVRFHTSAYPSEYGNALGAIADVELQEGNKEKFAGTAQAGLIGVDVSLEGPTSRSESGSFLFNYRYSTVGLLSLMGVPLGDEDINYQDFMLKLDQDLGRAGEISVWTLAGRSKNIFEGVDSLPQAENQKQLYDIAFNARTEMGGLHHKVHLGRNWKWENALAYSQSISTRELDNAFLTQFESPIFKYEYDELSQGLLSVNTGLRRFFAGGNVGAGVRLSQRSFDSELEDRVGIFILRNTDEVSVQYGIHEAWLAGKWSPNDGNSPLSLEGGLHATYYASTERLVPEPRLGVGYFGAKRFIHGRYGRTSQLPNIAWQRVELADGMTGANQAGSFQPIVADHFNLEMGSFLGFLNADARIAVFYQALQDVPSNRYDQVILGLETQGDYYYGEDSVNTVARNYGVELILERKMSRGFYYLLSGTVLQSEYQSFNGVWYNTPWNYDYGFTGSGGWEKSQTLEHKNKVRVFGVNLRLTHRAGLHNYQVFPVASQDFLTNFYDYRGGATYEFPAFSRLDLRLVLKKHRPRFTGTLALDIQNVLNLQNQIAFAYDYVEQDFTFKNSLGILPVLSYRMQFK